MMRMVEWKKLGEVASYYRGVTYNKKQEVPLNSGGTKILRANNISLENNSLNYDDVKEIDAAVKIRDNQWLYPNDILICAGSGSKEHVGKVAYISEEIGYAYGGFMGKIVTKSNVRSRFLFHILCGTMFKDYLKVALNSTTINNLNSDIISSFQIPLPPLSEQSCIVSILDTFTAMIDNLKQQIVERRKQYEHYREKLLTLDGVPGVEWKKLGEVAEIGTGSNNTVDGKTEGLYPFYTRGQELLWLDNYEFDETAIITAGDGAGVGKTFHFVQGKYALHQRAYRLVPQQNIVNAKFLFYYIKQTFYDYIMQNSVFGSVPSVRRPKLLVYPIPVPPLAVQQSIVEKLDIFTALIENIEKELDLRQKQYEYYRNKLLTFEK